MNSPRQRVALCIVLALLVVPAILAVALRGAGGGGKGKSAASSASAPAYSTASSPPDPSRGPHHRHSRPRRPPRAVHWQTAAVTTARTFVTSFNRWLAGEVTARQAPDVSPGYAAKLLATVNHVPPAARRHVAAIVHLVPAGMPPRRDRAARGVDLHRHPQRGSGDPVHRRGAPSRPPLAGLQPLPGAVADYAR